MLRSQRRGSIKRKMKVLFGTIAKNIEGQFPNLLAFASELFALQPDADLYLYENNSTDATRAFFPLLESCSPHVHVHSEDFTAAQQPRVGCRSEPEIDCSWCSEGARSTVI